MTPDDFEGLIFRLAWADDRRVVQMRAPDGGLDTVLPCNERAGGAERGWQAKRHTGSIDWDDCERSLDRAVAVWDVTGVTFAFPKNLSATEHTTFARRLSSRHPGVEVDYWPASVLSARLDTPDGRRIAALYFEEHDADALVERALRAGSPLKTGEDFIAAEQAIGEALALAHPDFNWHVHRGTPEADAPAMTPGAMLRISIVADEVALYFDLVARHESVASAPGFTLTLDDTAQGQQARSWLADLMKSGGRLELREGVRVTLKDVPPPFSDLVGEGASVLLKSVSEPPPFYARLVAKPDDESSVALDVNLLAVRAPEEWDAVLEGRVAGLTVALLFRWVVHEARGEARLTLRYHPSSAPHEVEARVLRWLISVHEGSGVRLEDRTGERPVTTMSCAAAPVESWVQLWAAIHEDLAELERWAGRPVPPIPAEVTRDDVRAIATVASMLRARSNRGRVERVVISSESVPPIGGIARDTVVAHDLNANVFGEFIPVARETHRLPPMIVHERVKTDHGWSVTLVPLTGDSVESIGELVPLADEQHRQQSEGEVP